MILHLLGLRDGKKDGKPSEARASSRRSVKEIGYAFELVFCIFSSVSITFNISNNNYQHFNKVFLNTMRALFAMPKVCFMVVIFDSCPIK